MKSILIAALVAVLTLVAAPISVMAADLNAGGDSMFENMTPKQQEDLAAAVGLAIGKSFGPLDTSVSVADSSTMTPADMADLLDALAAFGRNFTKPLVMDETPTAAAEVPVVAVTPVNARPAFVELGVYIQSGQIRSASILNDAGPFYVNDDTPPVSATIWVTPRNLAIRPFGVVDIPVKPGIDLSLSGVPAEANIVILVGTCSDLSVFDGKPMYSRLIHTYTATDGKTDIVAVVDCPR